MILALFMATRWRTGLAVSVGGVAALGVGGMIRYVIPGLWIVALDVCNVASGISGRLGTIIRTAIIGAGLIQLCFAPALRKITWHGLLESAGTQRREELGAYAKAIMDLKAARVGRVVLVGAWRSYLIPCRALFNGYWGENPLIWSAVNSSYTQEDLCRRVRQLGVSAVLFNIVSTDYVMHFQSEFIWDERMLRLYYGFCRKRLVMLETPVHMDSVNGGFYLMRFDLSERPRATTPLFLLPGAETVVVKAKELTWARQYSEARKTYGHILSIAPDVGFYLSQLGFMEGLAGNWLRAHAILFPYAKAGFVDEHNLKTLRRAAAEIGNRDEAIDTAKRCVTTYDTPYMDRVILGFYYLDRAEANLRRRDTVASKTDIESAARILSEVPDRPGVDYAEQRHRLDALIHATKGEWELVCGHSKDARKSFERALQIGPELPESLIWKRRINTISQQ